MDYQIENEQAKQAKPVVSIVLVTLNIIVFLVCTFTGVLLYNIGALSGPLVIKYGQYYRMITAMFLHADIDHLAGNMIFLYFLGAMMEKELGHIRYGILFLVSGLCGGLLSMGFEYYSGNFIGSIGASGAIFGVLGGVLFIVIKNKGKWESITLTRLIFVIAYSLYYGFTATNVDNAAHVGGLLSGIIITALLYQTKRKELTI